MPKRTAPAAKPRAPKRTLTTRQRFRQHALQEAYGLLVMGMDPGLVIELLEVMLGQVDGLASPRNAPGRVEALDQMEALRDRAYVTACSTNPHIVKLIAGADMKQAKLRTVPQAIASVKRIAAQVRALLPVAPSKPVTPSPTKSRTSSKRTARPSHLHLVGSNDDDSETGRSMRELVRVIAKEIEEDRRAVAAETAPS